MPAVRGAGRSSDSVIATDSQNAGNAGAYAAVVSKARRIAIIDDRTAFGQGEADEFEKAVKANGGTVVDREFTNDKAVDFSAQLTAIKGSYPDLVFFGGLDTQAAMLVKRMRQLGLKAQFLAGGGVIPAQYNAALKSTDYQGITGLIAFTQTGDLKNPSSTMYQVKSDAWVPVTTKTAD